MTLLVRAIVRASDLDRVATDDDIVAIRAADLAALASRIDGPVSATESALRGHDSLTRSIHERVASLPARFGQLFESEDDVVAAIEARAATLREGIATVDGRVEVAITLRWRELSRPSASVDGSPGHAYMAQRAADLALARRAEAIAARLVDEMAYERAHARLKTCPRPGVAAIVAILVDRDDVSDVRERVRSFGACSSEVTASVDGVFAPYSFAS
ncbi:MAG TPA: GvpL/GvpF family gas vesicle protein [Candidatus Limnocylindria bacterium]